MATIEGGVIIEGSLDRPFENAGAPVDGGAGTLNGVAEKGALLIDTTNADLYQNTGTKATPVWTEFADAGGAGPDIGLIGEMAVNGTATANQIGLLTKYTPVDHAHKLGDHDHTGDAGDGGQVVIGSFPLGVFTADVSGRNPFAAGLIDSTILGDGAVDDADKFAAGALSADATGRAVVASDFFDSATAEDKFEDSSIPSDKVNWGFGDTPNVIQPDDSASEGTSGSPARGDHEHGIVAAAPVDGSLAAANAEGAGTSFARSDHAHKAILLDSVELEFGTDSDAVIGWQVGDADNETLVIGLADANQAIHIVDKSAIGTDWNVAADTHPTLYVHSDTTPATDYVKLYHDDATGYIEAVGGSLNLDAFFEVSINSAGSDVNFRVQSMNESNMFVVDAALDVAAFGAAGSADKFVGISSSTRELASAAEYAGLHVEPAGAVSTFGSATTNDYIVSAYFAEPNIVNGGGDTITLAATVYIKDAPDEGATNSALYIAAGTLNPVGGIVFGTNPASAGNIRVPNGTSAWVSRNQANNADIAGWQVDGEDNYSAAADVNLTSNALYGDFAANGDLNLNATTSGTVATAYIVANNTVDCSVEGIATRVKAGAIGDGEASQDDLDGSIAIDSSNGRIYFRYGAAWHYAAQTAGVVCPEDETVCPNCDEPMEVGQEARVKWNETQSDGALHGLWEHVDCP